MATVIFKTNCCYNMDNKSDSFQVVSCYGKMKFMLILEIEMFLNLLLVKLTTGIRVWYMMANELLGFMNRICNDLS